MKPTKSSPLAGLRARLAEAEETLRAIQRGEVDAVVIAGKQGPEVFTLGGAEHAYRVLIESMNEGALTMTVDRMILYANHCFARMVRCPLAQVIGGSFGRFLDAEDQAALRPLLKQSGQSGARMQVRLHASDGARVPALISIRPLARHSSASAAIGMVVTDMTEAQRTEETLRGLYHRLMTAQETERGRVALELRDNITQLLCAVQVRSQVLAASLPRRQKEARGEVEKLSGMLGQAAVEVDRISRDLRPSALEDLGLIPVLRGTSTEFVDRTGVPLKLTCAGLADRLPADIELALYRILQEALRNVHQHACARHVAVRLTQRGAVIQLVIKDDGVGFDLVRPPAGRRGKRGFGLLNMRERVACVGGALSLKTAPGKGTTVQAQVPISHRGKQRSPRPPP